jgi:GNAT superfamily N-acetyltransferase
MTDKIRKKSTPKTNKTYQKSLPKLIFHPLTLDRWKDLEALFGERGACGGCWCMWWRLTKSEFEKGKGAKNKSALKKIVKSGDSPGILAYVDGKPVAWCSISPRESFPRLETSRVLKRIDDKPVWSVVCFFVEKSFRDKGVSVAVLKAAIGYAKKKGAKIVEGYPIDSRGKRWPGAFVYTALPSTFLKAGFKEVHRTSPTRPIMRCFIGNRKSL